MASLKKWPWVFWSSHQQSPTTVTFDSPFLSLFEPLIQRRAMISIGAARRKETYFTGIYPGPKSRVICLLCSVGRTRGEGGEIIPVIRKQLWLLRARRRRITYVRGWQQIKPLLDRYCSRWNKLKTRAHQRPKLSLMSFVVPFLRWELLSSRDALND